MSPTTRITDNPPSASDIADAAELIRRGGIVVFPTETVYGLGAHAGDDRACRRIFETKERPADNPLIVHVAAVEMISGVVAELPERALELFRTCSPGPLSVVLPVGDGVAPFVTAGHATVAVRIPSHPVAQSFLRACAVPVAAPSANRSGRPSPTTAAMVYRDLAGRVPLILDGGPCIHGVESTVLAVTAGGGITIYREGAVTREMIRAALGTEVDFVDPTGRPMTPAPSPGTRHAHYRPGARVVVVEASEVSAALAEAPRDVGVTSILFAQNPPAPENVHAVHMPDLASYAYGLYRALVDADDRGDRLIIAELPPPEGIGRAVRDRLLRAAGR
ncbi:MAG: L-threonylcarbamoyladenylate synthase [Spirochaetota bacterium]